MDLKFHFLNIFITASIRRVNKTLKRFLDLAPIENADANGNYTEAFDYALTNDRIKNIAITGPYGAGKSSIIKTYEKKTTFKFLNISLASFKESADPSQITLIERSILQQMLYGADANKLPYSRFKRISTPTGPLLKAIIVALWCITVLFIYKNNTLHFIPSWDTSSFYIYVLSVAFLVSIPVVLLSDIYKASFLISFKKISLTNAEIETGDVSESSILNRHLDEIIYFFQSTNYDVVVIEDLDRFQSPEIFVKLREINKLINDNERTRGNIKFLYALKDGMFEHKDRAKFFDFIIPVVPIINSSNSLDKMRERIQSGDSSWDICPQFLREVSLYLDDLRLIHNIFNEFSIYHQILKSENLNGTKLLAIIIYKNVYPEDFELLHHGNGALFSVGQKRAELVAVKKKQISSEVAMIKLQIENSNNEQLKSINELVKIFIGYLVSETGIQGILSINSDRGQLQISQIKTWEDLESLMGQRNLTVQNQTYNHYPSSHHLNKSFSDMESEISPAASFLERKEYIEQKQSEKRFNLERLMIDLEKEISSLMQLPLSQLLQDNDAILENILGQCKLKDSRLFLYLVRNGYIDETYHLYTSFFHEGRMTKNDRDFLLAIRDFKSPNPAQIVDTPDEVFKNMRSDDFSHKYILNVTLMDFILSDTSKYKKELCSAIDYISNNFSETEDFFSAYWQAGTKTPEFILMLATLWPQYGLHALKTTQASSHIATILSHLASEEIMESINIDKEVTKYISEFSASVFLSERFILTDYKILKHLGVKIADVPSIGEIHQLSDFIHENDLYKINVVNMRYLMERFSTVNNQYCIESKNYTSLSDPGCEKIKKYIEKDIKNYMKDVFLVLPNNSDESHDAIISLLKNEELDLNIKEMIISKQSLIFDSLDQVPNNLWEHVVLEDKVKPSWSVAIACVELDGFNRDILTEKIQLKNWLEPLKNFSISNASNVDSHKNNISRFIMENDNFSDDVYSDLLKKLPYWYADFPDVSYNKKCLLAENITVRLSETSFVDSGVDDVLKAKLIEKNADIYFSSKDSYSLTSKTKKLLIESTLTASQKFEICQKIQIDELAHDKQFTQRMSDFIASNDLDYTRLDLSIMRQLIIEAGSVSTSIRLLTKCVHSWSEESLMEAILQLPEPHCDIAVYGKRPKLQKTIENETFSESLRSKGFISSIKYGDDTIQINTFKSSDHVEASDD